MATIMVVDDIPVHCSAIQRLLKLEGYDVVCESNGKEALDAVRAHPPDVILLDIEMPELDGMTLLEILPADTVWRHVPVIMLTSVSDTDTIRKAHQLGAKEYLVKATFSVSEMLNQVRNCVDLTHATS